MALTLKQLKDKARAISPTVQIGKNGITDGIVEEVRKQLKTKRLVKIKFLRAFIDENNRFEAANYILDKTKSQLILQSGFMIVVYRDKPFKG